MKKLFPILQPLITTLFIFIACSIYGLSLAPSIILLNYVLNNFVTSDYIFLNALCLGVTLSLCFFIFGISLIFIVGFIFRILPIIKKLLCFETFSFDKTLLSWVLPTSKLIPGRI